MAHRNQTDRHFNDQHSCAHAWAHGHCEQGHASNFFFEGATIYSFGRHFPIAIIDGDRVFFTDQERSHTTSQHKSYVRSAISNKRIIYVQHVPSEGMIRFGLFHDQNIDFWFQQISGLAMEIAKHPRKTSLVGKLNASIGRLIAFMTELNITPSEKVAALLADPSVGNIFALYQSNLKERARLEKLRLARLQRKLKRDVCLWESGNLDRILPFPADVTGTELSWLRIHPGEDRIETSKGIEVPISTAFEFWQFILEVLSAGCQACDYSILDFRVDKITPDFIKVGCHTIPMAQAIKIARLLDWPLPAGA
jgi:hypothetical protein